VTNSLGERSAASSAAAGVVVLLGVGAAIPLWPLAKHSDWELALSVVATAAIPVGLYCMIAALIPLWPFSRARGDSEPRYRTEQRRQFARHVQTQLQQLAGQENWKDERFADLEAEVDVEGRQRRIPWFRHSPSRTIILRREKSLARALERSTEPLIVLEGDPGAGKSVALRHLAEQLSEKARRNPEHSKLPLYINLKEFHSERRPVDSSSVRDFIFANVVRVNDRDVERFMDEEFDRGLNDGSFVLLLDSFDEIPDILSSTEADDTVEEYALAIHNFLFGMRKSRAIVASREFRGPKTFREPRFTIVPLTGKRQVDLIRRSGLRPDQARTVEDGLATADSEIQREATNPMVLGLICEFTRSTGNFPESSYSVYESYLSQRFTRDAERLQKRYRVSAPFVRSLTEEIAFVMAASPGLGLSPTRQELRAALLKNDQITTTRLDAVLDALEYTKLGRSAEDADGSGQPSFTFAHRRFQEYFATCVVIRHPERVSAVELVTDGRWRETAVTILQTQSAAAVAPLLDEATRLIGRMTREALDEEELRAVSGGYCWPSGAMHLMSVVSAGLGQAPDNIPAEFRENAGSLLVSAWKNGRRYDKKWAVSSALVADKESTIRLLEQAFSSGSVILGGAAYSCVGRMADPSPELYDGVRRTLVQIAASDDLPEQKLALKAQVRRLPRPAPLIQTLRLLIVAPRLDFGLAVVLLFICAAVFRQIAVAEFLFVAVALAGYKLTLSGHTSYRIPGTRFIIGPDPTTPIFVTIYARAIAVAFAVYAVYPASRLHSWMTVSADIIAATLFLLWIPSAGYVCRNRRGIDGFLWPFIPFIAAAGVARKAIVMARKNVLALIFGIAAMVAEVGLLLAGIHYLTPLMSNKGDNFILAIVGISLGALVVVGSGSVYGVYRFRRQRDRRLVNNFFIDTQRMLTIDVLALLDEIRTSRGVRFFIESALRVNLTAHPDMIRTLSDIAATAEIAEAKRKAPDARRKGKEAEDNNTVVTIPGVTPEFANWLKVYAEKNRDRKKDATTNFPFVVRSVPSAMLDQIARSVEQVELARGTALF
jgi:hypothetical protein